MGRERFQQVEMGPKDETIEQIDFPDPMNSIRFTKKHEKAIAEMSPLTKRSPSGELSPNQVPLPQKTQ